MDLNRKHYPEIDIYRGLGIVLVVLGHSLKQTGVTNIVFDMMISVIYSFHMPLFFVASGFTSVKILQLSSFGEKTDFIKSRALRFLVPYFAVGLFYMPIKYILSSFAVKPYDFSNAWKLLIGENPNTVLWFLYTLFIISVICALILNHKNLNLILAISLVISAISYILEIEIETPKYLFFFLGGIVLRLHYDKRFSKPDKRLYLISTSIFIIANILLFTTQYYGLTIITAASGCICVLGLSIKIASSNNTLIHKASALCGKYSMDIYILSDFISIALRILLWGILHIHYIPCTMICFLGGMLLPIPISKYIIRKVRFFKLLILGIK